MTRRIIFLILIASIMGSMHAQHIRTGAEQLEKLLPLLKGKKVTPFLPLSLVLE